MSTLTAITIDQITNPGSDDELYNVFVNNDYVGQICKRADVEAWRVVTDCTVIGPMVFETSDDAVDKLRELMDDEPNLTV